MSSLHSHFGGRAKILLEKDLCALTMVSENSIMGCKCIVVLATIVYRGPRGVGHISWGLLFCINPIFYIPKKESILSSQFWRVILGKLYSR